MAQGARDVGAAHDECTVVSGLGYLARASSEGGDGQKQE